MKELERLQKEINGKVVWWRSDNDGKLLHAICIWPPNGEQVSIKPYGLSPREIIAVCFWVTEEDVLKPDFCLADLMVGLAIQREKLSSIMPDLLHLADGPVGVVYDAHSFEVDGGCGSDSSCPYG